MREMSSAEELKELKEKEFSSKEPVWSILCKHDLSIDDSVCHAKRNFSSFTLLIPAMESAFHFAPLNYETSWWKRMRGLKNGI